MKKLKAYKFRLYPNKQQEVLLNKTFGCVRFYYNQQVALFNLYDIMIVRKTKKEV